MAKSRQKPKSPMYTPKQKMAYEKCKCDSRRQPSAALLDQIADEKLSGRYDTRASNICSKCFMTKSKNGTCFCQ